MTLPDGLKPYKRTGSFDQSTVPAGLRSDHATKQGVWGLIHVERGTLAYTVNDPRRPASRRLLTPETEPGVVEPTILHSVEPLGPVRFYVEFLRAGDWPVSL